MSRRPVNPTRRLVGNGGFPLMGAFPSKTQSSPLLSLTLVVLGVFLILGYLYSGSGQKAIVSRIEGVFSGTQELQRAIPILKKAYNSGMRKVLHVGPETCSIVSKLVKEEETEAWGVEPYDLEDADSNCKTLMRKAFVRVADIKFPLPYKSSSFSLVIVSDALDYLSPKYLNKTIPELARVAADGIVIFTGLELQSYLNLENRLKCGVSRGGLGFLVRLVLK